MIFVTFLLFLTLVGVNPGEEPLTERRYDRLVILSYAITRLSSVLIVLQGGLGGPALAGSFTMEP